MPSTILSDNGVTSGTSGLKSTGSNDGQLALQTTTAGGTATTALTIDTSQNTTLAGNATAKSFIPNNSTVPTDGLYLPAASTVALSTGTTERMRIDSSGNVGIGTSSPSNKLDVIGAIAGIVSSTATTINTAPSFKVINTGSATTNQLAEIQFRFQDGTLNGNGAIAALRESGTARGQAFIFAPSNSSGDPTERARIDSTGRMLIATTTISSGSNTAGLEVKAPNTTSGQWAFSVLNSAGSAYAIGYRNDGYFRSEPVYAQTSASAANVYVDSNGYMYRSTSSIKYKKDVIDYDKGLTAVQSLRPVYYKSNKTDADGNENNHQYAGFIAEEIDAAGLTEFVQYGEDNTPEGLAYGNMVSLCVKAIQELKTINDTQTTRIETLEAQNAAFEARLAALENK